MAKLVHHEYQIEVGNVRCQRNVSHASQRYILEQSYEDSYTLAHTARNGFPIKQAAYANQLEVLS